ncbi:Putative fructokinase [Aquisphaera giovannonii]|uniref:Fructokinase n=1 Tax=Aquisphaera giovannonii TaxID=406548 RepID=A0A5B9WB39_9BACT|nr:ROK family protein [Aquisphaera giovannonii]QEH37888.1 Putative fructokinase [Aquisphaera giovannonii]
MADGWLLGIEIGGTKLQLGLGRGDGRLAALQRRTIDAGAGAPAILEQIREAHRALLGAEGVPPRDIRGAGVGFGGPVDAGRGRPTTSFQVGGWADFPLADWVREELDVPAVAVQNDADTAGLAEALLGAGVGCSPLLYLTIGSGIGGAVILDGAIYRGAGRGAVEIGHLQVPDVMSPGSPIAELEAIASGWGIAARARTVAVDRLAASGESWVVLTNAGGDPRRITADLVAAAAREGDALADAVLDRARHALAYALRQAVALLAPRRIILGGGVSLIGEDHWFAPIRRLVDAEVFAPFRGSFDIVPAALGEEVVVHGALALALEAASESSPRARREGSTAD